MVAYSGSKVFWYSPSDIRDRTLNKATAQSIPGTILRSYQPRRDQKERGLK